MEHLKQINTWMLAPAIDNDSVLQQPPVMFQFGVLAHTSCGRTSTIETTVLCLSAPKAVLFNGNPLFPGTTKEMCVALGKTFTIRIG